MQASVQVSSSHFATLRAVRLTRSIAVLMLSHNMSLQELSDGVEGEYKRRMRIKWRDEEEDLVTISSQQVHTSSCSLHL